MLWWILLGIFLFFFLLFVWIVVAIWEVHIDTRNNRYFSEIRGLVRARLLVEGDDLMKMRITVLGIPFKVDLMKSRKRKKAKEQKAATEEEKEKQPKKKSHWQPGLRTMIEMANKAIGSFRLKELYLNIDTDDCLQNAYLYPAFSTASRGPVDLRVNYSGQVEFALIVQNRLIRLGWAVGKTYIKSQFQSR